MLSCRSILGLTVATVVFAVSALSMPSATHAKTLSAQQAATVARITALQARLTDLQDTSRAIAVRLEVSRLQLASLRVALDNAEASYAQQQIAFDQRLVDIYKNGSGFNFTLLTGANDLNAFMVRMRLLLMIADADQRALISLRDQKITVAQAKDRMEEMESEQANLLALQRTQLGELRSQLLAQRRLLKRISAKIKAIIRARERALAAARAAARRVNKPSGAAIRAIAASVDGYPGQKFLTAYDNPTEYRGTGVKQNGVSSWYGNEFNGRATSSGEAFNENDFTAAHRTLPFGTYLAVRYQGRGIIVRITDRGPFISGRILDLSKRAAYELGIDGIGGVETEIVSPK